MKVTEVLWNNAASEFNNFKTDAWTIDHSNPDRALFYYKSILRKITGKEVFIVFPGFFLNSKFGVAKTDEKREQGIRYVKKICALFGNSEFLSRHELTPAFKCIIPILKDERKEDSALHALGGREDQPVGSTSQGMVDNKCGNGSVVLLEAEQYKTGPIFLFGNDLVAVLCHGPFGFVPTVFLFTGDAADEVAEIYNEYNYVLKEFFNNSTEGERKKIYKILVGTISYSRLSFTPCNISLRHPVCPEEVYNEDFPENAIDDFIKNEEGGLGIFYGAPGCGKSTYIKHLAMKFPEKNFCILSQDILFGYMSEVRNHLLNKDSGSGSSVYIIEDCEKLVVSRKSKENISTSVLSELLNMSDGIIGDYLNVKFILTFNTDIPPIDKALLRKGRLKIKYEFKPLCGERLKSLAEKQGIILTSENIKNGMSLADIFNYDSAVDFSKEKGGNVGFHLNPQA